MVKSKKSTRREKANAKRVSKRSAVAKHKRFSPEAMQLMKAHRAHFAPQTDAGQEFKICTIFDYSNPGQISDHS